MGIWEDASSGKSGLASEGERGGAERKAEGREEAGRAGLFPPSY